MAPTVYLKAPNFKIFSETYHEMDEEIMAEHDLSFVGLHRIVHDLVCYLIVYNVWWQIIKIYTANCPVMLSFYSQRSFVFCRLFA